MIDRRRIFYGTVTDVDMTEESVLLNINPYGGSSLGVGVGFSLNDWRATQETCPIKTLEGREVCLERGTLPSGEEGSSLIVFLGQGNERIFSNVSL